jgi:hypothetical protein
MTASTVTAAELQDWPVVVDLPAAAGAFGIAPWSAYALARNGRFPVEVLKIGGRLRCKTIDIQRAVGLAPKQVAS